MACARRIVKEQRGRKLRHYRRRGELVPENAGWLCYLGVNLREAGIFMKQAQPQLPVIDNRARQGRETASLSRRRLAQLLLGGTAAIPALAAGHPVLKHIEAGHGPAQASPGGVWKPEFLSAHQHQTLAALAERIIPGAAQAQAERYMDRMLSVESRGNQQQFLNALSAFDGESMKRHQRPFVKLAEAQQNELLEAATRTEPARRRGPGGRRFGRPAADAEAAPPNLRDHFEELKEWVRGAYYSSEAGMRDLGWDGEVAYDEFPGCQHPGGHP